MKIRSYPTLQQLTALQWKQ